jgi:hypothetical protein
MSLTNFPWPGINKLVPARDSLVSDIPAGDGNIITLFVTVYVSGYLISSFKSTERNKWQANVLTRDKGLGGGGGFPEKVISE